MQIARSLLTFTLIWMMATLPAISAGAGTHPSPDRSFERSSSPSPSDPPSSTCVARHAKAAGTLSQCLLRAEARHAKDGNASRLTRRVDRCSLRLEKSLERATARETQGSCSGVSAKQITQQAESFVAEAVRTAQGIVSADWLFSVGASDATLTEDGTLTLSGIDPEGVLAFTDRPLRQSTALSWEAFESNWDAGTDSFGDVPPNAALAGDADDGAGSSTRCIANLALGGAPQLGTDGTVSFSAEILSLGETCPEAAPFALAGASLFVGPRQIESEPVSAPSAVCTAAFTQATGGLSRCLMNAEARFARGGTADRLARRQGSCQGRFERRLDRAETRFGTASCSDVSRDLIVEDTKAYASAAAAGANSNLTASFLFAAGADAASLSGGLLSLTGLDLDGLMAFATRPVQVSAELSWQELADTWDTGLDPFSSDPPNAVLTASYAGSGGATTQCSSLLELTSAPQLLSGGASWSVSALAASEPCPADTALTNAFLFIDSSVTSAVASASTHTATPVSGGVYTGQTIFKTNNAFARGSFKGPVTFFVQNHTSNELVVDAKSFLGSTRNQYYTPFPQDCPALQESSTQPFANVAASGSGVWAYDFISDGHCYNGDGRISLRLGNSTDNHFDLVLTEDGNADNVFQQFWELQPGDNAFEKIFWFVLEIAVIFLLNYLIAAYLGGFTLSTATTVEVTATVETEYQTAMLLSELDFSAVSQEAMLDAALKARVFATMNSWTRLAGVALDTAVTGFETFRRTSGLTSLAAKNDPYVAGGTTDGKTFQKATFAGSAQSPTVLQSDNSVLAVHLDPSEEFLLLLQTDTSEFAGNKSNNIQFHLYDTDADGYARYYQRTAALNIPGTESGYCNATRQCTIAIDRQGVMRAIFPNTGDWTSQTIFDSPILGSGERIQTYALRPGGGFYLGTSKGAVILFDTSNFSTDSYGHATHPSTPLVVGGFGAAVNAIAYDYGDDRLYVHVDYDGLYRVHGLSQGGTWTKVNASQDRVTRIWIHESVDGATTRLITYHDGSLCCSTPGVVDTDSMRYGGGFSADTLSDSCGVNQTAVGCAHVDLNHAGDIYWTGSVFTPYEATISVANVNLNFVTVQGLRKNGEFFVNTGRHTTSEGHFCSKWSGATEAFPFTGYTAPVVAYTSDKIFIAKQESPFGIDAFDLGATGTPCLGKEAQLDSGTSQVTALLAMDDSTLIIGREDGALRLWDGAAMGVLATRPAGAGDGTFVVKSMLPISADTGNRFLVSGVNGQGTSSSYTLQCSAAWDNCSWVADWCPETELSGGGCFSLNLGTDCYNAHGTYAYPTEAACAAFDFCSSDRACYQWVDPVYCTSATPSAGCYAWDSETLCYEAFPSAADQASCQTTDDCGAGGACTSWVD